MKTGVIFLACILSSFCEKPLPEGFHSLKEWTVTRDEMEISYVLTKGTSYCLSFCEESSGTFILQGQMRKTHLVVEAKRKCIFWKCTKTEICYFKFINMNSSHLLLGFHREEEQ